MVAYFTGGGAGRDVQADTDGLQTLYLMNPNYVGYTDATTTAPNMMLLNSMVSSQTSASFGHQPTPAPQHFIGIPLQSPPSGYNLWAPAATSGGGGADMWPQQQNPGTSAVSVMLSLSFRKAPPVTVAAVPFTEGKYMGASPTPSQEHAVMSSKYLMAAQELLDEVVSVSKGVEEANAAAAKSAMAVNSVSSHVIKLK